MRNVYSHAIEEKLQTFFSVLEYLGCDYRPMEQTTDEILSVDCSAGLKKVIVLVQRTKPFQGFEQLVFVYPLYLVDMPNPSAIVAWINSQVST